MRMWAVIIVVVVGLLLISNCGDSGLSEEVTLSVSDRIEFDSKLIDIDGELGSFEVSLKTEEVEEGLFVVNVLLTAPEAEIPPKFSLKWKVPSVDISGYWTPKISLDKATYYSSSFTSRAARYAPVIALYNSDDTNRMTFACSDGLRSIDLRSYVVEEDANFHNIITFFAEKSPPITEYTVQLRVDARSIPLTECLKEVSEWWASQENYKPAPVPDAARRPMYSTWYSFHQSITADEVVEQCRLGKEIGLEAVIVDDGWQTLDSSRGYAFTGDWEPVRIGDMRAFVGRVHELDMKFLLWYSVPLMGEKSKNVEKFRGKFLRYWQGQGSYVLDPRFLEVREFIINTYEKALREWNLDGFKLDFIGMFRPDENTVFEASEGRDFASVDKAVDRLMTDIMARLRAIRPDIMIEFRQPYIGPLMRKYGNMFRATDCPNMAIVNRVRTTDIRLLSGDTAVHSDMFMWHYEDTVESAALQILNILFSVPQLSVKLNGIPDDHREMVRFWIGYWNENRDVLLDGEFLPVNPAANYPLIRAGNDRKTIVAVYNDMLIMVGERDLGDIDIVNAKSRTAIAIDFLLSIRDARITVFDCTGKEIRNEVSSIGKGIQKFSVPASGLLTIRRSE